MSHLSVPSPSRLMTRHLSQRERQDKIEACGGVPLALPLGEAIRNYSLAALALPLGELSARQG